VKHLTTTLEVRWFITAVSCVEATREEFMEYLRRRQRNGASRG
jgi:hypothetical protein